MTLRNIWDGSASLVLPKYFPERGDGKARLIHQCLEFNGKPAHFVGRLGTMPTGADFGEFSGKQYTQGGDQNKTRNDLGHIDHGRDYFYPGGTEYRKRLAQSIDQQSEIGPRPAQGIGVAAMFDNKRRNRGDKRSMRRQVVGNIGRYFYAQTCLA